METPDGSRRSGRRRNLGGHTGPGQNTDSPVVDARQERQQQRLYQGVDSGQLTGKEFTRLEREQNRIAMAEARMKSDGNLTAKERARLQNMQDRASRHIYRAKHNKRRAQ